MLANEVEYGQVDDVPLSTPAWLFPTLGDLYGSGDVHVEGTRIYLHHGEEPGEEWGGGRTLTLAGKVFGARDPDGALHPDRHTGLRRNMDVLKAVLRPQREPRTLLWHFPVDTDRDARCQIVGPVRCVPAGPSVMRATLPLWLPDGVLRDVTPTAATGTDSAAFDLVIPHAGTADQFDVQITLSGAATSVQIVSPAFGGQSLTFDGALGGGVTIDTGRQTATRDGADVHGLVDASGMGRWLVLPAGGDTWTVTPTGGSVTVDVEHRAAWA